MQKTLANFDEIAIRPKCKKRLSIFDEIAIRPKCKKWNLFFRRKEGSNLHYSWQGGVTKLCEFTAQVRVKGASSVEGDDCKVGHPPACFRWTA